jgi:hypothetical protein
MKYIKQEYHMVSISMSTIPFQEFITLPRDQQAIVFLQQTPEHQTHLVTRIGETTGIRPLTVHEWRSIQSSPQYHMTLSTEFWELTMTHGIFVSNHSSLDDYIDRDDPIDRLHGETRSRQHARLDVFYWQEIPYDHHSIQRMVNKNTWLHTHLSAEETERSHRAGRGGGRSSVLDRYKVSCPSLHASIHDKLRHVDILLSDSRDTEYYTFVRHPKDCLIWKLVQCKYPVLTVVLLLNYIHHHGLSIKPWLPLVECIDRIRIKTILSSKEESIALLGRMFCTVDQLDTLLDSTNRKERQLGLMYHHSKKQVESMIHKIIPDHMIEEWFKSSGYEEDGPLQCLYGAWINEMYNHL